VKTPQLSRHMSTLRVKLDTPSRGSASGHRVSVSYFFRFQSSDVPAPVDLPGTVSALSDAGGVAVLELPERKAFVPDRKLIIRVSAPDGQELALQEVSLDVLDGQEPVAITVEPKAIFPIQHNTDQAFLKPERIRGLLIDPSGKNRVGNKHVILLAQLAGTVSQVVGATRSDAQGYFSAPFPLGTFAAAFATVAGAERVPIRLNDDGSFPNRVVLAVDGGSEEEEHEKDGCACESVVPRDPDAEDLVNSPSTYSVDRGEGHCVELTKPNRVLQEFDFHAVVRSTEPQIKGLSITEPPKVGLADIVRIIDPQITTFAVNALPPKERMATVSAWTVVRPRSATLRSEPTAEDEATRGLGTVDPDGVVSLVLEKSRAELDHLGEAIGLAALRVSGTDPAATTRFDKVRLEAEIVKTLAHDPDGFSLTRLATAEILTRKNDLLRIIELIKRPVPSRAVLTCQNTVDWDDEPTFYQACTIAHGHILHFKQQWVADGYSLGDLVYSLPLAPGQKKQIAVIDWDRRETAARQEALQEQEFLSAQLSRDRDISEMANALVRESMSGGSEATTSSFGAGLGMGGIFGAIGGLLGIGGGSSGASSSAFQNSARSTSANSLQQLRDRVNQSATAVRSQRSTVVQTVNQGESMRVQTEYVANHTHCHAITMEYFEVLRHFLVRHRLADVQECLLVPLFMSRFDSAKARRWREPLVGHLRDRRLVRGFDALQRIADNYVGSDMPTGAYAEEQLDYLDGWLRLQFRLQRPRDNNDDSFLEASWQALSWLGISPSEWWRSFLEGRLERDRIFAEVLGPRIAREITNGLRFYAVDENDNETLLPIDATLLSDFVNDRPLQVSLRLKAMLPALRREQIKFIRIDTTIDTNAGPRNIDTILPTGSKIIVSAGQMGYRTPHLAHDLFNQSRILNDLSGTDGVLIFTPLSRLELRKPREEDKEYANSLLKHLNDHLEYYHRAIWVRMDAQRRYMLLDGFIAPNSGGRSVASVVENRLVGIIGNCLVLPVARGFHLDPTFAQDTDRPIDLLEHYQPTTPVAPLRLAVPTKGVFAEAVMGACNSCEKKDESRFWRWEESPTPGEPPAIQPVSTDSRRSDVPDLTPSPFPAPIVAFQNVPAAPDPQGFAGLLQLLSKPDLFRDLTGLTENQRNALAGLQAALGTAQFFGGKAADLALQANMNRDIDKALDKISEQHKAGAISEKQRADLTESALRSMIGGGTQGPAQPLTPKDVKELTETAGENNAAVSVARPGGETVTVNAQTDALELGVRTVIMLPSPQNDPESRAFFPSTNDKRGLIELHAQLKNAPSGGSHRWTRTDVGAMTIDSPESLRTLVRGLGSGPHELDFTVRDASGTPVASQKLQLSIPQFVTIDEAGSSPTPFDDFLALFALSAKKDAVLTEAKAVCDRLLSTSNVRTIWRVGPFSEALPAHLPASNVTTLTIHNEPPARMAGVPGVTHTPAGAAVLNETIDIYPGALDDPTSHDISVEFIALLLQIESQGMTADLEPFATTLIGRALGVTMSHEIVHSLLAFDIPTGHNSPAIPGDLMNNGRDFSFTEFTGFEDNARTSPVIPSNFTDHGLPALASLTPTNQALMNRRFPVPPNFT
jgi:hypothetical protein